MHRIDLYLAHADRERGNPVHFYRLANACLDGGSIPLWHEGVALALARPHNTTRSLDDRREALWRLGDWNGWRDVRWPTNPDDLPPVVDQWWDGVEDLSAKTVLIYHSSGPGAGGFGDMIRWLRLAEVLCDRLPARIFWAVPANLVEFFDYNLSHLPRMQAWDRDRADAHFDYALHPSILPLLVGPFPPFVRRTAPSPRMLPERTNQARFGFAWASGYGPEHLERSMPLRVLMPFFWRPDIEFHSLQAGVVGDDALMYPRFRMPDPPLGSFADTANLIASLDGVITIDTAVAHLAGSLGVPTLALLPFPSHALWGFADTTPWYPTMRLIRQRGPFDWSSIQTQVQEALESRWWEAEGLR
ncbi:MAG TPA: glycosyltransferase family 9 protein [Gemmatimonadaceae bacterium]|nr:glycosyltransferase family 9 protein [Gemmatimonadaceae bacterium]